MEASQEAIGKKKVHHSPEFIDSIIKLATVDRLPVYQIAQQTGIRAGQIYRWINKHKLQIARNEPNSSPWLESQLREVSRERDYLKKQVEFLKKAASYFASQNVNDLSSSESATESTK